PPSMTRRVSSQVTTVASVMSRFMIAPLSASFHGERRLLERRGSERAAGPGQARAGAVGSAIGALMLKQLRSRQPLLFDTAGRCREPARGEVDPRTSGSGRQELSP